MNTRVVIYPQSTHRRWKPEIRPTELPFDHFFGPLLDGLDWYSFEYKLIKGRGRVEEQTSCFISPWHVLKAHRSRSENVICSSKKNTLFYSICFHTGWARIRLEKVTCYSLCLEPRSIKWSNITACRICCIFSPRYLSFQPSISLHIKTHGLFELSYCVCKAKKLKHT